MRPFCVASLAVICVSSLDEDCSFGSWTNDGGVCSFNCNKAGNYVPASNLTYDLIYKECQNIRILASDGICDSIDDLVWSDSCGCPYCKCDSNSSTASYITEVVSWEPSKTCSRCTCEDVHWTLDIPNAEKIYDCETLIAVDSGDSSQWDFYSCPPNTCDNRKAGAQWWSNNESSSTCNTFCYCPLEGDSICATGYENIMADKELSRQFNEDCGFDVRAVKFFISVVCTHDTGLDIYTVL